MFRIKRRLLENVSFTIIQNQFDCMAFIRVETRFFVGLFILFVFASIYGCSDSPSSSGSDKSAEISGFVKTSDTGEGIEAAKITILGRNIEVDSYTDAKGYFEFTEVPLGEYTVQLRLPKGFNEIDNGEKEIFAEGNTQVEFLGEPIRQVSATVQEGKVDTLSTSSGASVIVESQSGNATGIEIEMNEVEDYNQSNIVDSVKPISIKIKGNSSLKSTSGKSNVGDFSITLLQKLGVDILTQIEGKAKNVAFLLRLVDNQSERLIYSDGSEIVEQTDSKTGNIYKAIKYTINLSNTDFEVISSIILSENFCGDDVRNFRNHPGALNGSVPLILVHGLQPAKFKCKQFKEFDPVEESFRELVDAFEQNTFLNSNYKLFTYSYPTNTAINDNIDYLWKEIKDFKNVVIVAHSMGGLIARKLLIQNPDNNISGLVTLGTPHTGSYMANLLMEQTTREDASDEICNFFESNRECTALKLGSLFPKTFGTRDLMKGSDFIQQINSDKSEFDKIYTLGGVLKSKSDVGKKKIDGKQDLRESIYLLGYAYMKEVLGKDNDGMVDDESSTPNESKLKKKFEGFDHSELVVGQDGDLTEVVNNILPVLKQLSGQLYEPKLTTKEVNNITSTSAESGGKITDNGGSDITKKGVCWSIRENPDINDECTNDGGGQGEFTSLVEGLTPDTKYYVRAYAVNEKGPGYGNQRNFTTESESEDSDWHRDTDTKVVDVTNPETGRTWMDRNLGASRAATSRTDEQAYGDLYQWGRAADGHQKRNSGTTSMLSSSDQPGHGDFILVPKAPYDWRSPQKDNLWQGVNGINNPCPRGYRLPTEAEWEAERQSWSSNNPAGAFASPLKLPLSGLRIYSSGSIGDVGSDGSYWAATTVGSMFSRALDFNSDRAGMVRDVRAYGAAVRCIKD